MTVEEWMKAHPELKLPKGKKNRIANLRKIFQGKIWVADDAFSKPIYYTEK